MIIQLEQIGSFAKRLIESIHVKSDRAYVVFLSGDLGSGKTTTTKAIAKELGIEEDITSPTFVILKRYEIKKGQFKNLIHIDAYRLKNYEELRRIKIQEYIQDSSNLILIEWPEMVSDESLIADKTLTFEHGDIDEERIVEIK